MASALSAFNRIKKLTFNTSATGANVATDQANFPICIIINSGVTGWSSNDLTDFFGAWNVNGKRAQFFDSDGTTNLSYEVGFYDATAKQAIYWVKIPSVTGNTTTDNIFLAYGNDPNSAAQDNATDVWSNGFIFVNHLNSLNPLCSKTGIQLTCHGAVSNVDAYIGKGERYPGADADYCDAPDTGNAFDCPTVLTISNWFKWNGSGDTNLKVMVAKELESANRAAYRWRLNNNEKLRFSWINSTFQTFVANTTCLLNTWYYGAVVAYQNTNGATGKERVNGEFYLNGAADGTWTGVDDKPFIDNNDNLRVGASSSATQRFFGDLDEIRIANVRRAADWLKLEYFSMKATSWSGDAWLTWSKTQSTATITAKARVKMAGVINTITAKARVKMLGQTKTSTAKARVKGLGETQSASARARAKQINITKTIQAMAKVLFIREKTIQAKARALKVQTGEVEAKARVKNAMSAFAQVKARIKGAGITKSLSALARVLQVQSQSLTTKGRIKKHQSTSAQARARVKDIGNTKSASAKARVHVNTTPASAGKSKYSVVLLVKGRGDMLRQKEKTTAIALEDKSDMLE